MRAGHIVSRKRPCPLSPDIRKRAPGKALCALCAVSFEQAGENAPAGEAICGPQNELRRLSAQILSIQESERQRIAADLHDGLGQALTLMRLELENCSSMLAANALNEVKKTLLKLTGGIHDTLEELRRVTMDLRPSTLDDLGILATLSWFFREFEHACPSMTIEKNLLVKEDNIPIPIKIAIFRILQEAISNIVKHAQADQIKVSLTRVGNVLSLTIRDNGRGFNPEDVASYSPKGSGLGLVSMNERAKFSGGNCLIESAIGLGTRISISWSLEDQASHSACPPCHQ